MSGQIKALIDHIIESRAKGNSTIVNTTRTKLILKGINPSKYTAESPDDEAVLSQLHQIAAELGVSQ